MTLTVRRALLGFCSWRGSLVWGLVVLETIPPMAVYLFSWVALVLAAVIGIAVTLLVRERTARTIAELEAEHDCYTLSGRAI